MRFETIVVGTDGSENAARAVEAAGDLVSMAGDGVVHLVSAHDSSPPHEIAEALKHFSTDFWESYDASTVQRVALEKSGAALAERGVDHVDHLVAEHPALAILDVADEVDADVVVVGNRGTGWATRLARGSVSTRVAAHTKRSVLIVH